MEATSESQLGPRELFKIRDFRLLWLAQVVSDFGDGLTSLALLLLVNKLTGSTAALATMAIALAIPQVTFGLLAGVYVDRMDRKRIMIVSDLVRGLLVLCFATVQSADQVWILYVVGFLQGAIGTFFTPARGAFLPVLVPETGLLGANSLVQTSRIVTNLLGAAAAGVLIGALDTYWPAFVIDSATFFLAMALIILIRTPSPALTTSQATPAVIFGQLKEGIRLVFHTRVLLGTLVAAGVTMLGLGAINILIVPFLINDLQVPTSWFGALQAAQTVGMILSGSLVAVIATRLRPTMMVAVALIGLGAGVGLMAVVGNVWWLIGLLFCLGCMVTPMNAGVATLVQTAVTPEVRGRSNAALSTLISTANLTSMALAGLAADTFGVRTIFVVGGVMTVIAGVASYFVFRTTSPAPAITPESVST